MTTQPLPCPSAWRQGFWRGSWAVYCLSCLWIFTSMRRVCTLSRAIPKSFLSSVPPHRGGQWPFDSVSSRLYPWPAQLFIWGYGPVLALNMLSRVLGKVGPCDALKMLEMGRSGSAKDFKAEADHETTTCCQNLLSMPFPFFCIYPLFLISFLHQAFWGQILTHLQHTSSCGDSMLLIAKLIFRLVRISSVVFTQQHAVNMCLNEARAKRIRGYHIFSETSAFLRLKCFML